MNLRFFLTIKMTSRYFSIIFSSSLTPSKAYKLYLYANMLFLNRPLQLFYFSVVYIVLDIAVLKLHVVLFSDRFYHWEQMSCQSISCRHHAFTDGLFCTTAPSKQYGTGLSYCWSSTQLSSLPTQLPSCLMKTKRRNKQTAAIHVTPSI